MALLLLMFALSCLRAGSLFDVIWQPAHLLRPKHYSRLGLGIRQSSSKRFFFPSMLIRLGSTGVFATLMSRLLFAGYDPEFACRFTYPDLEILAHELAADLDLCRDDPKVSRWCPAIERLGGCKSQDWSRRVRDAAVAQGVLCPATQTTSFEQLDEALWLGYCERTDGSEVDCENDPPDETSVWVASSMKSEEACASWPPGLEINYYCEIFLGNLTCDGLPEVRLTAWEEVLGRSCTLTACTATLPPWTGALDLGEQLLACACLQCRSWWTSQQCLVEAVDVARHRIEKVQYSFDRFQSPFFVGQVFLTFSLTISPLAWLVCSFIFWCYTGVAPWSVPFDEQLLAEIEVEEKRLAYKLESKGQVEVRAGCRLERFCIILEVSLMVLDVFTDLQMIWLYYAQDHYFFAGVQGLLVLRGLVEQLRQNLCSVVRETRDSLRANLRTDVLTLIIQSERTGEATLSFILQVYACFYTVGTWSAYWTAGLSLFLTARGITKGCYIHFDLAFLSSEALPPLHDPLTPKLVVPAAPSWPPKRLEGPEAPAAAPLTPAPPVAPPLELPESDPPQQPPEASVAKLPHELVPGSVPTLEPRAVGKGTNMLVHL